MKNLIRIIIIVCTFLLMVIVLTGCYSFNHIQIDPLSTRLDPKLTKGLIEETIVSNLVVKETKEPIVIVPEVKTELACKPYFLPEIPKTPSLPMKELLQLSVAPDNDAFDRLQTEHITILRAYILKMKKDLRESHNEYLLKCYSAAGLKPPAVN